MNIRQLAYAYWNCLSGHEADSAPVCSIAGRGWRSWLRIQCLPATCPEDDSSKLTCMGLFTNALKHCAFLLQARYCVHV